MEKKKQEKAPSAFGRLMEYAGRFRILTYLSLILSGLSSVLALMPFVFIWRIIREVLEVQPDFTKATGIVHNGWMAVLFAVLAWIVYVGALVCSHQCVPHGSQYEEDADVPYCTSVDRLCG